MSIIKRQIPDHVRIERNMKLYEDKRQGMKNKDLVAKYKLSLTQIYNIINELELLQQV